MDACAWFPWGFAPVPFPFADCTLCPFAVSMSVLRAKSREFSSNFLKSQTVNRPTWGLSWGSRHPSQTCSAFRMFLSWQVFPFDPVSAVRNIGIVLHSSLDFGPRSCQLCLRRILSPAYLSPLPLARSWRSLPRPGLNAAASLSLFSAFVFYSRLFFISPYSKTAVELLLPMK